MSKAKLRVLLTIPSMHTFIQEGDFAFYQTLVEILIPEVLRPIPPSLTQAIRNFAKSLESWLTTAMADCPTEITTIKLSTVRSFSQTLRRYTSLNHLAQAARAVLQNQQQITQMLADLNRVDFANVQEQASWVCGCDMNTVNKLEESFKSTLQQQASLETWASWLENVVESVLAPHLDKPDFTQSARQFLLRWSFYSSMIIRDLTLRSAASFGSFHLIRLLYDEFMFYIIEHRVAKQLNMTPVAVMGSKKLSESCHVNTNTESSKRIEMNVLDSQFSAALNQYPSDINSQIFDSPSGLQTSEIPSKNTEIMSAEAETLQKLSEVTQISTNTVNQMDLKEWDLEQNPIDSSPKRVKTG